jgi:hypothetical protein
MKLTPNLDLKVDYRQPVAIGMVVVDMRYIELSKIRRHQSEYFDNKINRMRVRNVVRPEGLDGNYIKKFRNLIRNGKYKPEHYIPPVVIETEEEGIVDELTGEHRYVAHLDEGEDKMWIAVCRFYETDGMPAAYWASTYQSNENDPEERVDDNVRTDAGVISATKNQIEEGWITSSTEDLKMSLKHQQIKGLKIQTLINSIQSDLGHKGCVRLTTDKECEREVIEAGQDSEGIIFRSMNNKGGIDPDYDYRLRKHAIDVWEKDSDKIIDVLAYFVGMNEDQVKDAREGKDKNSFLKLLHYAKKIVEYSKSGKFDKQLKIKYAGQLDDEGLYAE